MLTVIHGDDVANSRKFYISLKEQSVDPVTIDGDKVTMTDLAQVLEGAGLFAETKNIFIEQFLTKKKKSSEFKTLLDYINKNANENNIVLWEGKELEKRALTPLKTATVKAFKLPQTLFALLDAVKPGNGKSLVQLFHKTLENAETEMVFFMLIRQTRMLLALADRGSSDIDEVKRMAPWQAGKLQSQARMFSVSQLQKLYEQLFELEYRQKTGMLSLPLESAIDILLISV